jgi:hypothetical protein
LYRLQLAKSTKKVLIYLFDECKIDRRHGEVRLAAGRGQEAGAEFEKVVNHRGALFWPIRSVPWRTCTWAFAVKLFGNCERGT